jgi:tol-pal system protein YbgF
MRKSNVRGKGPVIAGALGVIVFGCLSGATILTPRSAYAQNQAAETEIRFQQLEKEIRRLTGQIEEQQYDVRQLRDQISELQGNSAAENVNALAPANGAIVGALGDYNNNMDAMAQAQGDSQGIFAKPLNETGGVIDSTQNNSKSYVQSPAYENETVQSLGTYSTSSAAKPVYDQGAEMGGNPSNSKLVLASTGGAAGDYDLAYSYIKARDFDNAEQAFDAFIKAHPDDDLISNAKYWYGETFYVRGNYDKAARVFAEGYQKYPQGQKAASNLLKLGMSLVGMGKADDACIAFKQLKKDYAKSAIPVLKRANTEMGKINCN